MKFLPSLSDLIHSWDCPLLLNKLTLRRMQIPPPGNLRLIDPACQPVKILYSDRGVSGRFLIGPADVT